MFRHIPTFTFLLTASIASAQTPNLPTAWSVESEYNIGPFKSSIECLTCNPSVRIFLEKDKTDKVSLTVEDRSNPTKKTRKQIATEGCFGNPKIRSVNKQKKVVIEDAPACGGNSAQSSYILFDIQTGKIDKVTEAVGIKMALDIDLIPDIENIENAFKAKQQTITQIRLLNENNGPLLISAPNEPLDFFSQKQTSVVIMLRETPTVITGSFKGREKNGAWSGVLNGSPFKITTKQTYEGDGGVGGSGELNWNGRKLKLEWSHGMNM